MSTWFAGLDPTFVFLLVLPFLVCAAGLAAEWFRRARRKRSRDTAVRSAPAGIRHGYRVWN